MAELQGSSAKAAYKKAVTWGTAVVLGLGDQFEYGSETVTPAVALIDNDQIVGTALPSASETGAFTVQGDLASMVAFYDGRERFVRDVFGDMTTTVMAGDPDDFQHLSDFKSSNQGFFGTLAFEKLVNTTSIHEVDSFKPMNLNVTAAPGDFVRLTVTGIGRKLRKADFDEGAMTNTASTTWTLPSADGSFAYGTPAKNRQPIRFGHTKVYIKDSVAGEELDDLIAPANLQCLSNLSIDFIRNSEPVQTTCDGDFSSEPSTDTIEISGTFEFAIYNDDNDFLVTAYLDKRILRAAILFDSGIALDAPADGNLRWLIVIPALQLTDAGYPNVPGLGRVPVSFPFRAHSAEFPLDFDTTVGTDNITLPRSVFYNKRINVDSYDV